MKIITNFYGKLLLITVALILSSSLVQAAKRVALVVGNSEYQHTSKLRNPKNDANLMAESLEDAGFEVTKLIDADYRTLKRAMLQFGRALRDGPEASLFYFAGHGVQVKGKNYLIPVNARIQDEDEVDLEAIDVNSFLAVMESSQSAINIVVLDACRNNPFARSFRSATSGLATVDAPKGSYIAYATSPGSVAEDGVGRNSTYTKALSSAIKQRGLSIEQVFKQTRRAVQAATSNKQVPWESTSITGDFFFKKSKKVVAPQVVAVPKQPVVNQPQNSIVTQVNPQAESVYRQIKDSNNVEVLEIFAEQYPDSIYTKFVKVRIKALKQAKLSVEPSVNNNNRVNTPSSSREDNMSGKELFKIAREQELKKNYKESARLYRLSANKGYKWAIYNLGVFYSKGRGVERDYYESSRLYKRASGMGHLNATYNLAIAYTKGNGVPKDYSEAARLYRIAVNKDHASAARNLALLYKNGQGVKQDYSEAARLFEKSALKNNTGAMYNLGNLYYSGKGVPNDWYKSAEWMFKSLNGGYDFALTSMLKNSAQWNRNFRIEFQRRMKREGYYNGAIDGEFGPATMDAIKRAAKG